MKTIKPSNQAARGQQAAMPRLSKQQTRAKARTSNACEACKRRKTKCSGNPGPCEICRKAETFCNFNPRLDTRRKLAYSSTNVQDRQQFMITALLQSIKHASEKDLEHLIGLIRGPSEPDQVAECLQKHFAVLQSKTVLPKVTVDSADVISFALQGLCGHRKGKPRPSTIDASYNLSDTSPISESASSSTSDADAAEETETTNEDLVSPESEESNGRCQDTGLASAEVFEIAINEPQYHESLNALSQDFESRTMSSRQHDDAHLIHSRDTHILSPNFAFAGRPNMSYPTTTNYTMMPSLNSFDNFAAEYPFSRQFDHMSIPSDFQMWPSITDRTCYDEAIARLVT